MSYKPIEAYGVIGNMRSVALVGLEGSIDWCCLPDFDSPSVFAAILDDEKGGSFKFAVPGAERSKQVYLPGTNVLVTRFFSVGGVGEVTDFMPVHAKHAKSGRLPQIVRIARSVRGAVSFRLECRPAFDYARQPHRTVLQARSASFESDGARLVLSGSHELRRNNAGVAADFTLNAGESAAFALGDSATDIHDGFQHLLAGTTLYWRQWLAKCRYHGPWREIIHRSALFLKLLTYEPTGAIIASPTCGLPEEIGGSRNWDYRYTWIRDAAFILRALLRLGFTGEADDFIAWLHKRAQGESSRGPLQVMYRVSGSAELPEVELNHLKGYGGSRPVRIGNAASEQLQLDIYGELIDAIYLYGKHAHPISHDLWTEVVRLVDWICENWERPDYGIWERRMQPQQLVSSKVQCWVALDRALRIADKRRLPIDRERIRRECDRIYNAIMERGWNPRLNSFVQSYDSDILDASSLLMALTQFVSPTDPRMLGTLDAITKTLVSDSLVDRYQLGDGTSDGLAGREGTFSMCTFWLAEVLVRAGRVQQGRDIFEKMLTYANHVGLFSEQIGARGEALGNFPQGLTHLGLISAALTLDRVRKTSP